MLKEMRPITEGSVTASNEATNLNDREAGVGGKKAAVDIGPYVEYIEYAPLSQPLGSLHEQLQAEEQHRTRTLLRADRTLARPARQSRAKHSAARRSRGRRRQEDAHRQVGRVPQRTEAVPSADQTQQERHRPHALRLHGRKQLGLLLRHLQSAHQAAGSRHSHRSC